MFEVFPGTAWLQLVNTVTHTRFWIGPQLRGFQVFEGYTSFEIPRTIPRPALKRDKVSG